MINYSPVIPVDRNDNVKTGYPPPKAALASTNRENVLTSSILLLTHDTTEIQVFAVGGSFMGIAGKWISQANLNSSVASSSVITVAGSANFDFVVPAGATYSFVVPISTNPQTAGSVQGVNRLLGLYPAVAFKTIGSNGSVLTAEF